MTRISFILKAVFWVCLLSLAQSSSQVTCDVNGSCATMHHSSEDGMSTFASFPTSAALHISVPAFTIISLAIAVVISYAIPVWD